MDETLKKISELRTLFFSLQTATSQLSTPEIRELWMKTYVMINSIEKDINPEFNCCPCKKTN